MKKIAIKLSLVSVSMLIISGCTFSRDALFPSLIGDDGQEEAAESYQNTGVLPALGTTNFEPIEIEEGTRTGTFVGQKVISFRNELTQLQNSIKKHNEELQKVRASVISNAMQYHKTIGTIEAKLQVGTTPGNPNMYTLLQKAQNNVQVMNINTDALNQLSARVASDAAMTTYLLDSIRAAYGVSGAIDEDHRQLRILENETNQTSILINSLLSEVNADISRQQQYIESARNYIVDLNASIKVGSYGVNNLPMIGKSERGTSNNMPILIGNSSVSMSKPLFVAKFNKADVNYQEALKQAVGNAVSAKPGVKFEIVAVSPSGAAQLSKTNLQKNAAAIFEEMIEMGVSANKISLSSKTGGDVTSPEIRIYVK